MAALVATRSHPKFKQAYLDLRAVGKPARVALVAIARRLVTLPTPSSATTFPSTTHASLDELNTVASNCRTPLTSAVASTP